MIGKPQQDRAQAVTVVVANFIDKMNETNELIAQRAYEIFERRKIGHGFQDDDRFEAEKELFQRIDVEREETDNAFQLTAQVPGFDAQDLEIILGHRRAVICGVHSDTKSATKAGRNATKIMRIIDIPFDIDPGSAEASLNSGTLQVTLPRSQ